MFGQYDTIHQNHTTSIHIMQMYPLIQYIILQMIIKATERTPITES